MGLTDWLVIIGVVALAVLLIYRYFSGIRKRSYDDFMRRRIRSRGAVSTGFRGTVAKDRDGVERVENFRLVSFNWVRDPFPENRIKDSGNDRSEDIL